MFKTILRSLGVELLGIFFQKLGEALGKLTSKDVS